MKNFIAVQSLSLGQPFAAKWTAEHQASLSFTISQNFLKFISVKSMMLCNHLILCSPFLLLPSIFHSIRFFSSGSALCKRWPQFWSFDFSISPSNVYSGLISFRIDWFDLLAGDSQESSSASVGKHQSFRSQPSLWSNSNILYITIGKIIDLTMDFCWQSECLCFFIYCLGLS